MSWSDPAWVASSQVQTLEVPLGKLCEKGRRLLIVLKEMTYERASQLCLSVGGRLAAPGSLQRAKELALLAERKAESAPMHLRCMIRSNHIAVPLAFVLDEERRRWSNVYTGEEAPPAIVEAIGGAQGRKQNDSDCVAATRGDRLEVFPCSAEFSCPICAFDGGDGDGWFKLKGTTGHEDILDKQFYVDGVSHTRRAQRLGE